MSADPDRVTTVTTHEQLRDLVSRVRGASRLAVDTESASFHRYVDRVYLVQLSTEDHTWLVDPLAVDRLDPLGALLADASIELVFHDADYDLRTLDRDYGFQVTNVFDTKVAARLCGEPALGLAALLDRYLGVRLDKKYQRADWSARPLPAEMMRYAADDTRFLIDLRDRLDQRLRELARDRWAAEEFRLLEGTRWSGPTAGEAYLQVKGAGALTRRQLAVLRAVFEWRDARARSVDRAPFRILGNDTLLEIARRAPQSQAELRQIRGITSRVWESVGAGILEAVRSALSLPEADLPRMPRDRPARPGPDQARRVEKLRALRDQRAAALGLDPPIICPNATLQAIARAAGRHEFDLNQVVELRKWQREAMGDDAIRAAVS